MIRRPDVTEVQFVRDLVERAYTVRTRVYYSKRLDSIWGRGGSVDESGAMVADGNRWEGVGRGGGSAHPDQRRGGISRTSRGSGPSVGGRCVVSSLDSPAVACRPSVRVHQHQQIARYCLLSPC